MKIPNIIFLAQTGISWI